MTGVLVKMSHRLIAISAAFLLALAGLAYSSFVGVAPASADQPAVTYSTTTPWPGQQVTATLDDSTGVSSYQWQWSLNAISWGDAGETGNRTVTFTVPNKAGFKFRLSWMRDGVREYATTYVTVTDETVTYSTTTPAPGQQVTATLSGGTSGVTYQWQASWDGNSWGDATETGNDTKTITLPSSSGMKFRVTWTRSGIGKNASSYVTVTDETVTYSTTTPAPGQQVTATLGGGTSGVTYQWQASWDGNNWGDAIETGNDTDTFTVPNTPGLKFRVTWTRNGVGVNASSYVTVTASTLSYSSTTPAPGAAVTATLADETGVTAYQWQASWDGYRWGDAIETGNDTKTLTLPWSPGMKFRATWTRNGVKETATNYVTISNLKVVTDPSVSYSNTNPLGDSQVTANFGGNTTGITSYQWQWSVSGSNTWRNAGETGYNTTTFTVPNKPQFTFRITWVRNGVWEATTRKVTVKEYVAPHVVFLQRNFEKVGETVGVILGGTLDNVTAYRWQERDNCRFNSPGDVWTDVPDTVTGYNTRVITLPTDGVGKSFRLSWRNNGVWEYPTLNTFTCAVRANYY